MASCIVLRSAMRRQVPFLTRRTAIGAREIEFQTFSAATRWNSSVTSAQEGMADSLGTAVPEPNDAKAQKEVSDSIEQKVPKEKYKGHHMLSPFTAGWQSTDIHPLIIDKSEGVFVYDSNGKKYLDALAGLWCNPLGGNEPRLVAAATKQLNKLPFYHSFWNRTTQPSLDLAKEVLEIFKAKKMSKAFFTNGGSDANDTQFEMIIERHSNTGVTLDNVSVILVSHYTLDKGQK